MSTDDSETENDPLATTERTHELTASETQDLVERAALAGALGHEQSHGGKRNYYQTFGWPADPDVEDYLRLYLRGGYASTIVDAPADTSWRNDPEVDDRAGEDTEKTAFEKDITELVEQRRLWHYCKRIDRLAGVGDFGVMLVRYRDNGDWADPVDASALARQDSPAERVAGFKPLTEHSIETIVPFGPDTERWGEPQGYKIDLSDDADTDVGTGLFDPDTNGTAGTPSTTASGELWVHHERALHLPSDHLLDDEVRGAPRMESVYNNLLDVMKVRGAAAEHAYRGLDYGLHAKLDPEYRHEDDGKGAEESIDRYLHGLQPYIQTQGVDIDALGGETIDPGPVIDAELDEISAATRMPKSVLRGKEVADRAKSEDLREWYGHIAERQSGRCTHLIVRPLIEDFVRFGVVRSHGEAGYDLPFPPLAELSETEQADVQTKRAQVVKRTQAALPGLGTDEWREYLESGEIPEPEGEDDRAIEPAAVEDLARRIEEGDGTERNGNGEGDSGGGGQEEPVIADGGEEDLSP
jgi:hypothetical protein